MHLVSPSERTAIAARLGQWWHAAAELAESDVRALCDTLVVGHLCTRWQICGTLGGTARDYAFRAATDAVMVRRCSATLERAVARSFPQHHREAALRVVAMAPEPPFRCLLALLARLLANTTCTPVPSPHFHERALGDLRHVLVRGERLWHVFHVQLKHWMALRMMEHIRRVVAGTTLGRACHAWIWAPACADGTVGIVPRTALRRLQARSPI